MQNNLSLFLKKLGLYLAVYAVCYVVASLIALYTIIYSDTQAKMLGFGSLCFLLQAGILFFLFMKVLLLMKESNYLGKTNYLKIAGICLLIGIVAGVVGSLLRLGLNYIFAGYYQGLYEKMHAAMIDLYTNSGFDVVALKQRIADESKVTFIQAFITDVLMTFKFSIAVALLTPLLLRKKLKADMVSEGSLTTDY